MLQIGNVFFVDQPDVAFTTDIHIVLDKWWNTSVVRSLIEYHLCKTQYDVIFTMLPVVGDHGEHQAATVLLLESVASLPASAFPEGRKPIVLGGTNPLNNYTALPGYPLTSAPPSPSYMFDRLALLSPSDSLNYMLMVSWAYACHKSQGGLAMELTTGLTQTVEHYWSYDINDPSSSVFLEKLFTVLAQTHWVNKW